MFDTRKSLTTKQLRLLQQMLPVLDKSESLRKMILELVERDSERAHLAAPKTLIVETVSEEKRRRAIRDYFETWLPISYGPLDEESRRYLPYIFEGFLARAKKHFAGHTAGEQFLARVPIPTADDPEHLRLFDIFASKDSCIARDSRQAVETAEKIYKMWAQSETSDDDPEKIALWKVSWSSKDYSEMVAEEWLHATMAYFHSLNFHA